LIFPKVRIIVVNYNQVNFTLDCIESLINADADPSQIIVVDNNSKDNSVDILADHFGTSLNILTLGDNKGYPYALNKGIPLAVELGGEWLLLMNNDVVVDESFLKELALATREYPEIKLFGSTILYYDNPKTIWYIGYKLIPGTLIGVRSFRGRKYDMNIPKYIPIDVMHGCTMMVNKSVFEDIGLFDDSDLIYGDDADFSLRAREAGYKMMAATRAKMWHKISMTMGREKPKTHYLRTRNTITFYRNNTRGMKRIIMFSFTFIKAIFSAIKDIFRGYAFLIRPLALGFMDGWKGVRKDRDFN